MTEKMVEETCHHCLGKGEYEDAYDDMWGNSLTYNLTCDLCEGEGKIKMTEKEAEETREYREIFLKKIKKD
jgi:DnaJ-class molecular chaperone